VIRLGRRDNTQATGVAGVEIARLFIAFEAKQGHNT